MSSSDKSGKRLTRKLKKDLRTVRKKGTLLQMLDQDPNPNHFRPRRIEINPLTEAQERYDKAINSHQLIFGVGPAGTGKTWWAAMRAAEALDSKRIKKIVVSRPAVEAGENLGFLPGEEEEKYEPYFRPVRDALEEYLGTGALEYYIRNQVIEARPIAFLRGATLKDCWVILDEAQNITPSQMKMFLTRIGENSKFIVNGDPSQKDIPGKSGLIDAMHRLKGVGGVSMVKFGREDIVRSGLCQAIAERYEDPVDFDVKPNPDCYNSASESENAGLMRMLEHA